MKAKVTDVIKATPSVVVLRLKPEGHFEFKAGQFISILVEHEGKKSLKPYSVASSPAVKDSFELCVKVVEGGAASNYLAAMKKGDEIEFRGPFGHFTLQDVSNGLVFVATGTGISALKPMISEAFNRGISHDVWLLFGVRTEQGIIFRKDFEALEKANSHFHFIPVLSKSDDPNFEQGHVQDAFRRLIKPNRQDIYICGLYVMVDEVRQLCRELGFPDEKVHYEKYV